MAPSNKFAMDQVFRVQKVICNEIQGYSRFKQLIPGSNDKISKFKAYSRSQGPTCQIPGFQGFKVPLGTLFHLLTLRVTRVTLLLSCDDSFYCVSRTLNLSSELSLHSLSLQTSHSRWHCPKICCCLLKNGDMLFNTQKMYTYNIVSGKWILKPP